MTRYALAADGLSLDQCVYLVRELGDRIDAVKIHSLYDEYGPEAIARVRDAGPCPLWVDHKLHDIPKTVALRAAALVRAGADILTTHASGGVDMMKAVVDSGASEVFAVTILTSLEKDDARDIYGELPEKKVLQLALLAKAAGVHGVVCSALEVGVLARHSKLRGIELVVPGVRSPGASKDDQSRVDTPSNAVDAGATVLVLGREITNADDPVRAIDKIRSATARGTAA